MTISQPQHDVDRYAAILDEAQKIKGVSLWQDAWRRLRRNWAAMIALVFLLLLAVCALITPLLPLQSPIVNNLPESEEDENRQFLPPNFGPYSLDQDSPKEQAEEELEEAAAEDAAEEFAEAGDIVAPPPESPAAEAAEEETGEADTENDPGAPPSEEQVSAEDDDSAETVDSAEEQSTSDEAAAEGPSAPLIERLAEWEERMAGLESDLLAAQAVQATGEAAIEQKAAEIKRIEGLLNQARADDPINKLWNKPGWIDRQLIRARLALFGSWCIPSLCGTDSQGRDMLARLFWGARVSLMVGLVASLVSLLIGVTYGATAGFLGGWVDNAMMRFVDVLYSIPFIFVVIFLLTFLSSEGIKEKLEAWHIDQIAIFYVVIGAIYWLTMSRVVRGQVISLKNEQFVDAARTIGASRQRIILRHLIPNVMSIVIVYLTLTIPAVMLFEAFLSFLGLGVKEPDVSWGMLASDGIKVITPVKIFWWLFVFPGLALALTLLSLMFLGDGLRDALDPKMKNR